MRQSLRFRSKLLASVVSLLTLATVLALALTTSHMQRAANRLVREVESAQALGSAWSAMLYHSQVFGAFERTGSNQYREEAEHAAVRIRAQLNRARLLVDTPEQQTRLDQLTVAANKYLANPVPEEGTIEEITGRPLETERELAMSLLDASLGQARATLESARRWERMALVLGMVVLALLGTIVAGMMQGVHRQVIQPLGRLRSAVVRFRPDVPFVPVEEEGVDEIRDIGRSFNRTAAELLRQRALSLRFVASIAHDLRNPISALALASRTIKPDSPLPPEEKVRSRFELISRQANRLNRMVEDLLDTTRIEAGHLSLELADHDLVELVRDAIELNRPLATEHELVVSLPDRPVWSRCDGTRVSQVLNNLINNAIKYSPGGGRVSVTLTEAGGFAWIAVADTGIGIPESERESIFEPFRRSSKTRGEIPGIGLGLSVARRIVVAHGGTIEVESEVGRGSTFRVSLPLSRNPMELNRIPTGG